MKFSHELTLQRVLSCLVPLGMFTVLVWPKRRVFVPKTLRSESTKAYHYKIIGKGWGVSLTLGEFGTAVLNSGPQSNNEELYLNEEIENLLLEKGFRYYVHPKSKVRFIGDPDFINYRFLMDHRREDEN